MEDIPHERKILKLSSKRLTHLATDYGINAMSSHRAMSDCQMTMEIMQRHDMDDILDNLDTGPSMTIVAEGPYNPALNEKIKEAGFKFRSTPTKHWEFRGKLEPQKQEELRLLATQAGWKFTSELKPRAY